MKNNFFVFNDYRETPDFLKGSVVVIGNFDGIHSGHQQLLKKAKEEASKRDKPLLLFTFNPHPRIFFSGSKAVKQLLPSKHKHNMLRYFGVDAVLEQNFTDAFARLEPKDFIDNILIDNIEASLVIVGDQFHFAARRAGTPEFLQDYAKLRNLEVFLHPAVKNDSKAIISSSNIRQLLAQGMVEEAAKQLGYHYFVQAEVVHGQALGRKLGFPTANMHFGENLNLPYGIYAIKFLLKDGRMFDGVANFGLRPTVLDDGAAILESYIFDFDEDIYNQVAFVIFIAWLRPEEKFDNLDILVEQIKNDVIQAKQKIAQAPSLPEQFFLKSFD